MSLNARTIGEGIARRTIIDRLEDVGNDAVCHTPLAAYYHVNGKVVELNEATIEEQKYIHNTFTGIALQLK